MKKNKIMEYYHVGKRNDRSLQKRKQRRREKGNPLKKKIMFALKLMILLLSLYYVAYDINVSYLLDNVCVFSSRSILLVFFVSLLSYGASSFRLSRMTAPALPFRRCLEATVLCLGLNNILPAKAGEIAKAVYLARTTPIELSRSMMLVFWERFFDVNLLLCLVGATFWNIKVRFGVCLAATIVLFVWGGVFSIKFFPDFFLTIFRRISWQRPRELLLAVRLEVLNTLRWSWQFRLFILTLTVWSAAAAYTYVGMVVAAGLPLTLAQTLSVLGITSLGMLLPSTPGSLGVYEAAHVFALSLFGVAKEPALLIGVTMHMIQYIPTTVAGIAISLFSGFRRRIDVTGS